MKFAEQYETSLVGSAKRDSPLREYTPETELSWWIYKQVRFLWKSGWHAICEKSGWPAICGKAGGPLFVKKRVTRFLWKSGWSAFCEKAGKRVWRVLLRSLWQMYLPMPWRWPIRMNRWTFDPAEIVPYRLRMSYKVPLTDLESAIYEIIKVVSYRPFELNWVTFRCCAWGQTVALEGNAWESEMRCGEWSKVLILCK